MIALATLISVPIGIAIAVWLVEYGRGTKRPPPSSAT